jgi:hypothetical protein
VQGRSEAGDEGIVGRGRRVNNEWLAKEKLAESSSVEGALSVSLRVPFWVLKLFIPWRGSQSSGAGTVEASTYYTLKSEIPCVWIYGSLVVNVAYSLE